MLTGFAIQNFKSLARVPEATGNLLPFGPLNVLIGPNGCGKSSLLQGIDFLRAFFETSVEVYLRDRGWDYRDLPNLRQTSKSIRWHLTAELDADADGVGRGRYEYVVTLQPRKHLGVGEETLDFTPANGVPENLLSRKGRDCSYMNRHSGERESRAIIRLPASLMSRWDPQIDRRRYPEALHFRRWIEQFRSYLIWGPKDSSLSRPRQARSAWLIRRASCFSRWPVERQTPREIRTTGQTSSPFVSNGHKHLRRRPWLGLAHDPPPRRQRKGDCLQ